MTVFHFDITPNASIVCRVVFGFYKELVISVVKALKTQNWIIFYGVSMCNAHHCFDNCGQQIQ